MSAALVRITQANYPKQDFLVRAVGGCLRLSDVPPDHSLNQIVWACFRDCQGSSPGPVFQDGDAVGNPKDFLEAMRNVNDTHSTLAQSADHREEPLRFCGGRGCGWFVENHDPCFQ